MSLAEIFEQAMKLSIEERKQLIKLLIDSLDVVKEPREKHSILELAGLGKEIWEGVDAQEYVNQLRSEWDHRS